MTNIYTLYRNNIPFYVGKTSSDPKKRERDHRYKYGKDIKLKVVDICSDEKEIWKSKESYWIKYFQSLGFILQNQNEGGGGPKYHNKEVCEKISIKRKNKCIKPILQYDLQGNFIKEWSSIKEANLNLTNKIRNSSSIGMSLLGYIKTAYGFIWRYKNNDERNLKISINGNSKVVEQYNKDGQLIKEYPSYIEARKCTNIDMKHVLNNKHKTAGGFIWKYKNKI
jgi:hypothetical protein